MNMRKFYANSDHATAVNLVAIATLQVWVMYMLRTPLSVSVAVALTCVCMGLLAGIIGEVFWGKR